MYGATANPVDPSRSACGSSGGEAAAVGSGMSAFGIGSDYGGSIRAPAHFCGVVGMRPGLGRIPTAGHLPHVQPPGRAYWSTIGPFARSVADLALVLSVLVEEPLAGAPLPRRVGIYRDGLDRPLEASCAAAVGEAGDRLGLDLVRRVTPPFQVEAERLYETVSAWESRTIIEGLGDLDQASPHLRSIWELVREAPAAPFDPGAAQALEARAAAWLEETPVLLCPAAAAPAHLRARLRRPRRRRVRPLPPLQARERARAAGRGRARVHQRRGAAGGGADRGPARARGRGAGGGGGDRGRRVSGACARTASR